MSQNQKLNIGIIGLDTSHVIRFTELLNDSSQTYHVQGGTVVCAYPGGSQDFEFGYSRIPGFTDFLKNQYGVEILDSPEEVAVQCDAILLESADGRVHLEQFKRIVSFGKPVFIDKPMATDSRHAAEIAALAGQHGVPVMSSSALRYAEALTQALSKEENGEIIGFDSYGPMMVMATQPGLFWYGIHAAEMLFAALGPDCEQVRAVKNDGHDVVIGEWSDGRIGTIRGNRKGNSKFGGLLHRDKGTQYIDVSSHPKPFYASLLEKVMTMFETGTPDIDVNESLQIIRFIEAANESRENGGRIVKLRDGDQI